MGGVSALAYGSSKIVKNKATGIFWMSMSLVFLTAIILNGSRAALALFGLGLFLFFGLTRKNPRRRTITSVLVVAVVMAGAFIFVSQGGELQKRFSDWMAGDKEGRIAIYQDAASMVKLSPLVGVGLGNFEGVFNTLRVHSADQMARALHPESDWWWIATEMGIGGVVTAGLLVGFGFHTYLLKTHFPSLTKASITIATLFLIHSLFDVGGHLMGTLWSCLYLVGLGASRPLDPRDLKLPKIVLRMVGLLLLVLASLRIQSVSLFPWMPTQGSLLKLGEPLPKNLSMAASIRVFDRGVSWAPLDWSLYYRRGLIELELPDNNRRAEADFNRALYLEQNSVEVPTGVGGLFVQRDFPEAMRAWKQILLRQKIGYKREEFFENINYDDLNDQERDEVISLAGNDPDLKAVAIIMDRNSPDFSIYLQKLLDTDPSLEGISKPILRRLSDCWSDSSDVDSFIKEWPLHPELQAAGWRAYARALAKKGRERDAATIALRFMSDKDVPNLPVSNDLDDTANQFRANPQDPYKGLLLYSAQKSKGLNDQAINTLLTVANLPQHPSYIPYLLARDLLQANKDKAAWQVLDPVLDAH